VKESFGHIPKSITYEHLFNDMGIDIAQMIGNQNKTASLPMALPGYF
jgi:hypothetical protein